MFYSENQILETKPLPSAQSQSMGEPDASFLNIDFGKGGSDETIPLGTSQSWSSVNSVAFDYRINYNRRIMMETKQEARIFKIGENEIVGTPETREAIYKVKARIKEMAEGQRQLRLDKEQKDVFVALRLTVLHRLYLQIRGKEFEEVHKIRKDNQYWARGIEDDYREEFKLEELFLI